MKPNKPAVLTHDTRWRGQVARVKKAALAALAHEAVRADCTIVLSNDAEVQALNRDYRSKDKPTNVLSFPDGDEAQGVVQLGDIILAYETIALEAMEQHKTFENHMAHLVVHGVLHLLGYDHELGDDEAEAMEAREIDILHGLAIDNPYAAQ